MNKFIKKSLASTLVLLMASSNLLIGTPVAKADPVVSSASYSGIDKTTKGQWNNKYGKDGYILFGYGATAPSVDVLRVDNYVNDIVKKPDYIENIGDNAYQLNNGTETKVRPLPVDPTLLGNILDIPAGAEGTGLTTKVEAAIEIGGDAPDIPFNGGFANNAGRRTLTFHLDDTEEHLFTVYSTKQLDDRWFGIEDLIGTDLLPLTKGATLFGSNGSDSTYVTFKVKGSFQFHYDGGWENIGLQGVFFDSEPEPEVAPEQQRTILGLDSQTSGQWHNKYGGDGYILVGYDTSVVPKVNEWSTIAATPSNDIKSLPSYVDSYQYETESQVVLPPLTDSDRYYNYVIDMPPGNTADTDLVVVGQPRKKYRAYAQMNRLSGAYTFTLNDDQEHVFSFYSRQTETVSVQLTDLQNNIIAERSVLDSTFNNGGYVSFLVKGSFKIVIGTPSKDFGATSFFFDAPVAAKPMNLAVEALPGRKAGLTWTNAGSPDKLILERRQGNDKYTQLAVLNGTAVQYEDVNLTGGQTYSYRLRNVTGTGYSSATESVNVAIPLMTETVLTLTDTEAIQAVVGTTVAENVYAQVNYEGLGLSPLNGATVKLRLHGEHVGDGISFGEEIPEIVATGITDINGMVALSFTTEFAGTYTLDATMDPDDVNKLAEANSAAVGLTVDNVEENNAPFILKLSDAVKPGKLFTVNGYGMDEDTVDIAIELDLAGTAADQPSINAIHPVIVQKDRSGFFTVAEFPLNAQPGVYNVWVKNSHGWSAPSKLNAARPLFISDYEAYSGIDIDLAGRNFDQSEFGGSTHTKVRLNNGEGSISATTVKSLNPYGITFTVGSANPDDYFVEVSNDDGINWSRLDNGQKVTVVAAGEDPLGLGVAWASDFNWENEYDVTNFGATQNDQTDDTNAVQDAVDAAEETGGVVYFPKGSYYIETINLPSGVVLLGEDTELTKLYYTGTNKNFIDSTNYEGDNIPERQGVANLSLLLTDATMRPDSFIWIGEKWGNNFGDMSLRQSNRLFVTGVKIDYPTDSTGGTGSGRGIGIEFIAKERILIQNNHFVGWHAQPFITSVNQYYTLKNNYFEFTEGFIVGLSTYAFFEGNHVKAVNPAANRESHGLFARSNAYIAGNIIENMGDHANAQNDGEAIALEIPNALFNYGKVLKATSTTVLVAPEKPVSDPVLEFGALSLLITDGKGMGQMRKISSRTNNTYHVGTPFEVVPDNTSRFTLITPNDNATIYDNTITNNAKGIWLFGNSFDSVVAGNTSVDSEGIFMYTVRNNQGISPGYYTRIADNHVEGISRRSDHGGIGFNTSRNTSDRYYSIDVYSTEILNNSVSGDNTVQPTGGKTEAPGYGGIYAISASHSSSYDNVPGTGDSTNTIIEDNSLSNLGTGVDLTHSSYGQIVRGNSFDETVLKFINDTGSMNTIVDNNNIAAPSVTLNDVTNIVTGLTTAMEYKLDSAEYIMYDAAVFNALNLSGSHTLLVRIPANVITGTPAGFVTKLIFTSTPTSPTQAPTSVPTPTPTPTPTPAPTQVPGVMDVEVITDANGQAVANVNTDEFKALVNSAKESRVLIDVHGTESAKGITVNIPSEAFKAALEKNIEQIQIQSSFATVSLATDLLEKEGGASGSIQLSVTTVDPSTLSDKVKQSIGNNPVYDFNLIVNDRKVSKFGHGDVKVQLDYTLKPGENPHKIVIYYLDDKGKLVTVKNGKYDKEKGKITFGPMHFSHYVAAFNGIDFKDIAVVAWAKESIEALAAREIVMGVGEASFKLEKLLTRAEFITMLMNAFDLSDINDKSSFSDVKEGAWYYSSVASAEKLGISKGNSNGKFGINDLITRQEMAVMIYKAAQLVGANLNGNSQLITFKDQSAIADYASEAVMAIQKAGIINGLGDGNFAPKGVATRAQAAVVIWRLLLTVQQ
ncbi:S-layer homology domain-containing protein [Paenibacillus psychroresistens]|nr:S-layer homology domain-containing protein [Paenibacillus psychroresistens]